MNRSRMTSGLFSSGRYFKTLTTLRPITGTVVEVSSLCHLPGLIVVSYLQDASATALSYFSENFHPVWATRVGNTTNKGF